MTSKSKTGDAIALKDAAALLGLSDDLLTWALEEQLLVGSKDKSGGWTLAREQIERGQLPLQEQFSEGLPKEPSLQTTPEENPAEAVSAAEPPPWDAEGTIVARKRQPAGDEALSVQPPRRSPDASLDEELRFLRRLVEDQNQRLADKDRVVTELARSIASLAEEALNRDRNQ